MISCAQSFDEETVGRLQPAESGSSPGARSLPNVRCKPAVALLVEHGEFAVLHLFEDGRCIKTATGAAESLRIIYRGQYKIWTFGVCRVCGCNDHDCRICIERTGQPCSWMNDSHTLCSACSSRPITGKATV